jgi:hypothetical protein
VVAEVKELKGWLAPDAEIARRLGDARAMVELLEAEPDEDLSGELRSEVDKLDAAVERFELQTMLQGPDD